MTENMVGAVVVGFVILGIFILAGLRMWLDHKEAMRK
jgi:hypothetical protein